MDPSAEGCLPLTATSTARAHVAHAPLRRLSEAALSACSDAELIALFARRGARRAGARPRGAGRRGGARRVRRRARRRAPRSRSRSTVARLAAELGAELAKRVEGAAAALLVPIAWAGDVRHVAILARRVAAPWAPDEVLIAATLANQAALGLARLEAEQRRVAQAERDAALARAAHALNVSLELQAVLDTLAREADLAVGGAMAGVYLLDEDGSALATAGHNVPDEWFGYRLAPGEGIAGQVLAEGRPVTTSDYEHELTLPGHIVIPGVRSGVGVPMCWNGELRGALSIGFLDQREVASEDLHVLEAIADLAVVACHNAEAYDDIRTAASTDALTGLLNHGAMQVRVREEIARAAREEHPLCCVLIDLDDFKRVNDELGHPAGDALLRRVADALRAEVRPYDQVARYGGDEFVLVLPGAEEQTARAVAERVRARVQAGAPRSHDVPLGNCSIGVSAWQPGMSADELLAAADRALLLAKRTGKGRVAVANPDAEEELARLQRADASPAAVQALAAAIDARDDYTHGHSEQVVTLATNVAMLLGPSARDRRADRPRRAAARRRQARDPPRDPPQGRLAGRRRVAHDVPAPGHRRGHPAPSAPARPGRADRAPRARALGRQRLPGRARRRADPDRLAHHPRLRRVRRDDHAAPLPARAGARRRRRPAPRAVGLAVRPGRGRGAARRARHVALAGSENVNSAWRERPDGRSTLVKPRDLRSGASLTASSAWASAPSAAPAS